VTAPLEGKGALVTGAASGIGRACAKHLSELVAYVVVADRDAEGEKVAKAVGGEAWAVDLADVNELASSSRACSSRSRR
jgi:3-hydroxybutyrate dehydrogenase